MTYEDWSVARALARKLADSDAVRLALRTRLGLPDDDPLAGPVEGWCEAVRRRVLAIDGDTECPL